MAFLRRIRIVADKKKDTKTVEAVDELLTAEDQRHSSANELAARRRPATLAGA